MGCGASFDEPGPQQWRVIRKDGKGVLVRETQELKSEEIGRLMKGAVIEEVSMGQSRGGAERLQYRLVSGNGPSTGWVNTDLIERIEPAADDGWGHKQADAKKYGTELYHQTDEATAAIILRSQEMKPGSKGLAGGGIYFATSEELTGHKAHAHGVILKAYVRLGKIHTLEADGDTRMSREKLTRMGFDSVVIARKVSSGQEYVVYDPAQVLLIERA